MLAIAKDIKIKLVLSILFLLVLAHSGFSQATFTSAGDGAWNNAGSWTESVGDDGDNIPDADDIVIIQAGDQIDFSADAACLDLTVDGIILYTINGVELRVYGDLSIPVGGLIDGDGLGNSDLKISPTDGTAAVSLVGSGAVITGLDDIIHSPTGTTNYTGAGDITVEDRFQLNRQSTVTNGSTGTIRCNNLYDYPIPCTSR